MTITPENGEGYVGRTYRAQDDLQLYYREYGDARSKRTPLLCLAGLTRNCRDYHALARRLCGARRIVCPDYRGRGLSARDANWRNYQPHVYVEDIRHLMAVADLCRVVVLGTSLGGLLAMALAVARPGAIAGAIINDIGPDVAGTGLGRIRDYIGRDRPQRDWPGAVAELKRLFPNMAYDSEAKWRGFAERTYRRGRDDLLHFDWDVALVRSLDRPGRLPDLWPMFRALRPLPVLALRGEHSDVLSAATFERMAREHPRLDTAIIADAGHAPELNEPESVHAIDGYLTQV